jgi:hypothetical protein
MAVKLLVRISESCKTNAPLSGLSLFLDELATGVEELFANKSQFGYF